MSTVAKRWQVDNLTEEDTWFNDYVKLALTTKPVLLPPSFQRIGNSDAVWFPTEPGVAFIRTTGGSPDDRLLAELVVKNQLKGHGYRQALYSFDQTEKTSSWDDVMAKAVRLKNAGNVTILRNGAQNVVGHVIGDHGEYQTEISREDPNSQAITQWQCECPWDQYAWQRTRQWKKYEGRPCAHVLATYWASRGLPIDEESQPQGPPPGGGPPSLFNAPPTAAPPAPTPSPFQAPGADVPVSPQQYQQMQMFNPSNPQAPMTPKPAEVLPQFVNPYENAPVVNPASVPGLRQPSPTNPTQYPGGTFSSWQFESATIESMDFNQQPKGFQNGNMISTKYDDWGVWVGKSEAHGAGARTKIPKGSIGEVLGQDPTTGMVNALFMGDLVRDHGPLEPYGATAWFLPSEIVERPDVQRPGPAIKRRR